MKEYKELLASVSEMELSQPKPSVNYVQMEIGVGEPFTVDLPRRYPQLLTEVAPIDAGTPSSRQRKAQPAVQAPQPKAPPPQVQPAKPIPPQIPITLQPKPSPFSRIFGSGQKPAIPPQQPEPPPLRTLPPPIRFKPQSTPPAPVTAPSQQKTPPTTTSQSRAPVPAPQPQQPKKGWFSKAPTTPSQKPPEPKKAKVPERPAALPRSVQQPKPLEVSAAEELTMAMKDAEIAPSVPVGQVYVQPQKNLVLPMLSLADQDAELGKIIENIKQNRFDSNQMDIVKDEVEGLAALLAAKPQTESAYSPFEQDLRDLRKARLAEALQLIKGM